MAQAFVHKHASHCESGVMSSFLRLNGLPLIAYRMPPGTIIRGLDRGLALGVRFETFRNAGAGMRRLDELLEAGKLVGLQTSIFWLPYIPRDLRFHFNAHNLLVYGREGDEYLISDPVVENVVRCPRRDLEKARFAKGVLAPKGRLYYTTQRPAAPEWKRLGQRALQRTARIMLRTPLPLIGVRGMRWLARSVERLPLANGGDAARLYIGHIVRMQEEIGTGGAGFRFMYASFLQELAAATAYDALEGLAQRLVTIGDRWQEFAIACARMIKRRDPLEPRALGVRLRELAADEESFFHDLDRARLAWQR